MKRLSLVILGALSSTLMFGQEFKIGTPVAGFQLHDTSGKPVTFSSLKGEVTVVGFVSTKCPVSNNYNERMKAVYNDYAAKGVKFIFVNSNSNEPASEVAEHARAHGFPFPVHKDEGNVVADRFGASYTPEMYVIDKSGMLAYHGHIDDSQRVERIQTQGLRTALDEVLAGKTVTNANTKAFGCTIKRAKKVS